MATVTTITSSVDVEVSYVCSVCGTQNTTRTKLQASANNEKKASQQMQTILTDLASEDPTRRYIHANLKCKCAKCHHAEPWANLDFFKLDILVRVCCLIGLLAFLPVVVDPYSSGIPLFSVLCLLAAAVIFVYKKVQAASSAKKIAALPAQSLPTITRPSNAAPSQNDIMARVQEKMNNK